ncbi:hypothetical protein [Fluviicola sp.]|uniref:hypothetical protein n=1 Tax=Fluviicola sp. TaxID=1917219 RepID=UPI003D2D2DDC
MARFISISLVLIISNTFIFAQKYGLIPMRMLVQETGLVTPFVYEDEGLLRTAEADRASAVTMHLYNNANSNYLMVEILGASKVMPFQLVNTQGEEVYSGSILGTQLIETESWPAGTYYFLCGTKRETIYITK